MKNPANIPAENLPTGKRGRKRAAFDATVREIVAEMEVRGTTPSDASVLIAGDDEYAEMARYAHRQIVKPDAPSTDRQLPPPVMCTEAILDGGYQLCGACGKPILNDEICIVAPVVVWYRSRWSKTNPASTSRWFLYFHPACALDPSSWTKRIYSAMRVMDAPFEYATPERARHIVYDPLLRGIIDLPSRESLRTLSFVPFPDGCTRISADRFVDVLEGDGRTTLRDQRYWSAQFQIMRRSMEKEIATDDYGLDRASLVRISGGGRRVVTANLPLDGDSNIIAVPVQEGPAKSGHPVFRNFIETEFVNKLDTGTLRRDAEIAWKITTKEIEKIVVQPRPYEHVPVLCGTDQRTAYRGWEDRDKARRSRAHFVSGYDNRKIPGEYATYSGSYPERHDSGEKLSPRPEFEYFLLSCPDLREPAGDIASDQPRGPVDELAAKTLDKIKEFTEGWKSRPRGDGRVSFSKWMPNERPRLKVSVRSGRDALEAALSAKWLPGQIHDEVPTATPPKPSGRIRTAFYIRGSGSRIAP